MSDDSDIGKENLLKPSETSVEGRQTNRLEHNECKLLPTQWDPSGNAVPALID